MKLGLKCFLFILTLLTFGLFLTKNIFASSYNLSGKVSDNSGFPIAGAMVDIYSPGTTDGVVPSTIADSLGNYSETIPEGTYDIKVTPPPETNLYSAIAYSQSIFADTIFDFILTPAGIVTLSGHIYDAVGNPIPNIYVQLLQPNTSTVVVDTQTNSSGDYSFTVSPGNYGISIAGKGSPMLSAPEGFQIGTGLYSASSPYSLTKDVILDFTVPAKRVNIHVQDQLGQPINNVTLSTNRPFTMNDFYLAPGITNGSVTGGYTSPSDWPAFQVITDSSGNATLWLFALTYTITATPLAGSVYQPTTSDITITGDTSMTITVMRPYTLVGHIYDPLGNPVSNIGVQLLQPATSTIVVSTQTDANGVYSLTASPGNYAISVAGLSTTPNLPRTIQVGTGLYYGTQAYSLTQDTILDITIPAKRVDIHVQDQFDQPISNVILLSNSPYARSGFYLAPTIPDGSVYGGQTSVITDSSGNATLWLFALTYTITATPPGGSAFQQTTSNVTITDNTNLTITMVRPVTLSGHIYDAVGNPIPNINVALYQPGTSTLVASTETDPGGYYSLTASPGNYGLSVHGAGSSELSIPSTFGFGTGLYSASSPYSLTQDVVLDFTMPAKKVDVHIQDQLGDPVGGVTLWTDRPVVYSGVYLTPGISNGSLYGGYLYSQNPAFKVTTDTSGNATLWLPTNTYTITASPPVGSVYDTFILYDVSVRGNQTELISLQYNHNAPITTVLLTPNQDSQGFYSNPTVVTFSATAATGFTVANTYYKFDGGPQQTYSIPFTVSGSGDHTVTYWSVDNVGVPESRNTKTFTIHVNQPPVIDDIIVDPSAPSIINTTINASASFSDLDILDTHTATWNWGDGSSTNGVVTESNGSGTVTGSHIYTSAGVYTLAITVTDNNSATVIKEYKYVVIYDPSAGFVTGGGQVSSSPFGISAKYTPNSQTPVGNVGYTFSDQSMVFASTSIDWLVVNGTTAYISGYGTINGSGNYSFLASASDGSPDKLRIKITDSSGSVVYDNQPGDSDASAPTVEITAGQIKIH